MFVIIPGHGAARIGVLARHAAQQLVFPTPLRPSRQVTYRASACTMRRAEGLAGTIEEIDILDFSIAQRPR